MKQREIKFRAWNKLDSNSKERMIYPAILDVDGEVMMSNGDSWDIPIMQYTGLKDKNGKEIFEGDIVLYGENKLFHSPPPKEMKGVIVYNEWWAKFIIEDKNGSWNPKYTWNGTQNEKGGTDIILVIGNIYENPELLKKIK